MWKTPLISCLILYSLDIVPQYEHIFGEEENSQRLPENVRTSRMRVQLFDGALRQTRHMLEADYRTAVPQYYNHGIQLLIPVCLHLRERQIWLWHVSKRQMAKSIWQERV